ncbi:multicopper oxidase [Xylariales sp. AK1849]|nr:multicopper oxidase [Xylariales sp. AK1849]
MLLITAWTAVGSLLLSSFAVAAPVNKTCHIGKCDFDSAKSPKCWGDYSLETNYYDEVPYTGNTREYWLDIQNGTAAPDGVERMVLTVNGQFPGPTIEANWGDWVVVHVTNSLTENGTSIHWHGIRQSFTSEQDGVASITQCPVAPGDSMTYRWRATQYGHSWYHSHYALQAWNGVIGTILIHGPASAPYDEDKGVVVLGDWFHDTTDNLWSTTARFGAPPKANNGLINGMNTFGDGGKRWETSFTSGKRHRIRLVNSAIDTFYRFMVDGHTMTVIATDLVPIKPYTTDVLSIGIGQRYDVIIEANQDAGDYWMRAIPDTACSATNDNQDDIKAIVRYDASSTLDPDSTAYDFDFNCYDEALSNLVPYVPIDIDAPTSTIVKEDFASGFDLSTGFWKWTINGNTFLSNWSVPTLVEATSDVSSFGINENVVQLNDKDTLVYFIVQSQLGLTHPIHLHGHDFFLLAHEPSATYTEDVALQLTNPPRRDVAMLPANGYLVIGFITDNPGVWLMHCHIGWHASQGFALQVVERRDEIAATVNAASVNGTCARWQAYEDLSGPVQDDSGI